jgi:DNA-binding GntR family transcriptional regulator
MADIINKQTLSEQIYQILRGDILNQRIKCGQKLTLQSLKDRFNVSHTPIRDALTRLVEDDLVLYYSNVGITVITLTALDAREIFQLSGDLDCLAMRYCCDGPFKKAMEGELDEIMAMSVKYLQKKQYTQWRELSDQFHLVFYKYANNTRLENAAQKLRAQITLLSNLYQFENKNVDKIQEDHEAIYQAVKACDIEKAMLLMRGHLDKDLAFAIQAIG